MKNVGEVSVVKNTYENVHSFLGSWISSLVRCFSFGFFFINYAFLTRMYIYIIFIIKSKQKFSLWKSDYDKLFSTNKRDNEREQPLIKI